MASTLVIISILSIYSLSLSVSCKNFTDPNFSKVKLEQSYVTHLSSKLYMKEVVIDIPRALYRYVMFQAVSQANLVSVAYSNSSKYGQFVNGSSSGLIYMLNGKESSIRTFLAAPKQPTSVQFQAIVYTLKDPVPGGCCITCAFDNDPNIQIIKEESFVKIMFARANVFNNPGSVAEFCDGHRFSTYRLEYDLYALQLYNNDLSIKGLYDATWKMSSVSRIKYYGKKVATKKSATSMIFSIQYLPYKGFVYNIIVRDPKLQTEAAYNPNFSYGCDITNKESCKSFGPQVLVIYSIIIGIIGLALCFAGHKFFTIELFIGGVITGFLVTYILMLRFSNIELTRQLKAFSSNLLYILTLACISLFFPIPLAFFPKASSIAFASIYGALAIVLTCSVFLHANLPYIVLEFILRAGIPSFADSYLRVPFQRDDFILCGTWVILIISGAITQSLLTRGEKFPPLHNPRKPLCQTGNVRNEERRALLQNEQIQYGAVALTPSPSKTNYTI
eukprot:gene18304-20127_t